MDSSTSLESQRLLVIGGTGTVGRAVVTAASEAGIQVISTSSSREETHKTLDVRKPNLAAYLSKIVVDEGVSHCVVAAGVSGHAICRATPEETRRVNVLGSLRIAEILDQLGIPSLFFSTNLVFGEASSWSTECSPFQPVSEYGRQKTDMERGLSRHSDAKILRLTKVLGPKEPRWTTWKRSLEQEHQIRAFANVRFAPLSVNSVGAASLKMFSLPARCVRNASPAGDLTYFEAAQHLASAVGVSAHLVQPEFADWDAELGILPETPSTLATRYAEWLGEELDPLVTLHDFINSTLLITD